MSDIVVWNAKHILETITLRGFQVNAKGRRFKFTFRILNEGPQ